MKFFRKNNADKPTELILEDFEGAPEDQAQQLAASITRHLQRIQVKGYGLAIKYDETTSWDWDSRARFGSELLLLLIGSGLDVEIRAVSGQPIHICVAEA